MQPLKGSNVNLSESKTKVLVHIKHMLSRLCVLHIDTNWYLMALDETQKAMAKRCHHDDLGISYNILVCTLILCTGCELYACYSWFNLLVPAPNIQLKTLVFNIHELW